MKKSLALIALYTLPSIALAAGSFTGGDLPTYLGGMIDFVNKTVIPLIIALAILIFIWGMFQYFILGAADDEKKGAGKQLMLWGLIGFVVMFSLVGIINLLVNAVGLNNNGSLVTPTIPFNVR